MKIDSIKYNNSGKLSYNITLDEFNEWVKIVREIKNWADNITNTNESVIYSSEI